MSTTHSEADKHGDRQGRLQSEPSQHRKPFSPPRLRHYDDLPSITGGTVLSGQSTATAHGWGFP